MKTCKLYSDNSQIQTKTIFVDWLYIIGSIVNAVNALPQQLVHLMYEVMFYFLHYSIIILVKMKFAAWSSNMSVQDN